MWKFLNLILKTPKIAWIFLSSKFQECNFIIKISTREKCLTSKRGVGVGVDAFIMEKNKSNSSDSATPGPPSVFQWNYLKKQQHYLTLKIYSQKYNHVCEPPIKDKGQLASKKQNKTKLVFRTYNARLSTGIFRKQMYKKHTRI